MARRRHTRLKRDSKGRFLRRRNPGTKSGARKGWARRVRGWKRGSIKSTSHRTHAKYLAKNPRRRHSRRRRNPFLATGRRGAFKIIPGMGEIKNAAVGGAGAVASEIVRASVYSVMGRDLRSTSILEDAAGRIVAGGITGMLVGYVAGGSIGSKVTEGAYTVAMYELVADAVAMATGGKEKVLGFIANPFANRAVKPLLPSFGGSAPALSGIMPEGAVLPLGAVYPEGNVIPLGADELQLSGGRFGSRF